MEGRLCSIIRERPCLVWAAQIYGKGSNEEAGDAGHSLRAGEAREDKPDIMTKDFDIEVEIGSKHDIRELERKLANATKKIYVVVPNDVEKRSTERSTMAKS